MPHVSAYALFDRKWASFVFEKSYWRLSFSYGDVESSIYKTLFYGLEIASAHTRSQRAIEI